MSSRLNVSLGQCSDRGLKEHNQDFHGALVPAEPLLSLKGVVLAMADGISTSTVSQVASETAVKSFLDDYYCTSDAWTVRNAAQRVLTATNSWLHAQTRRSEFLYDRDRGYVCTISALVIKAATAHLFHVGDTRVYRVHGNALEQLTRDHRLWASREQSCLSRALGMDEQLELDYQAVPIQPGDIFILATDGVYEHVDAGFMTRSIRDGGADLDAAARTIVEQARERGSPENLSIQILRIDSLPGHEGPDLQLQAEALPLPPMLEPRMHFDGYRILREVHASSRSHVFLALDEQSDTEVILKIPSIDLSTDPAYLERFLMEEWIARRLSSAQVLKAALPSRPRNYLYTVTEHVDGQTLAQWLVDHPRPDLETVRTIVEQIARGCGLSTAWR
ncbi:protein phosphatase 2C domain-containing protein [Marinobacterium aestuariivivens]|uniref:Protein phosphatase 2C domain-containing protein n=1 Tax=Marinobacterium aestuariivivens TaxID=1698799 RepID=A0ABW1ZYG1_9GAMM